MTQHPNCPLGLINERDAQLNIYRLDDALHEQLEVIYRKARGGENTFTQLGLFLNGGRARTRFRNKLYTDAFFHRMTFLKGIGAVVKDALHEVGFRDMLLGLAFYVDKKGTLRATHLTIEWPWSKGETDETGCTECNGRVSIPAERLLCELAMKALLSRAHENKELFPWLM